MAVETDTDERTIPAPENDDSLSTSETDDSVSTSERDVFIDTSEGVVNRVPSGYRQEEAGDLFQITRDQYVANRKADVRGTPNPSIMNNPFWIFQVSPEALDAWGARNLFGIEEEYAADLKDPVWCFIRFGATRTKLPDGRLICIGGEHEDGYDPDFFIYNDVVVYDAPQKTDPPPLLTPDCVTIYGYPVDVFPPTDFHTSTYYADSVTGKEMIFIIGGLGYANQASRERMDIYKLDLSDFSIHRVATSGTGPIGPVHNHKSELLIENEQPVIRITTKPEKNKPSTCMAAGEESTASAKNEGTLPADDNEKTATPTRYGQNPKTTRGRSEVFTLRINDMRWI